MRVHESVHHPSLAAHRRLAVAPCVTRASPKPAPRLRDGAARLDALEMLLVSHLDKLLCYAACGHVTSELSVSCSRKSKPASVLVEARQGRRRCQAVRRTSATRRDRMHSLRLREARNKAVL